MKIQCTLQRILCRITVAYRGSVAGYPVRGRIKNFRISLGVSDGELAHKELRIWGEVTLAE
jgi:hypothetical protein